MFGHGDFGLRLVDAFTGGELGIPGGILLTVNDEGSFFNQNDFWGNSLISGPRKYAGNTRRAQDLILVHEMAHGIMVPGFQPDLDEPAIGKENNKLVDTNCRKLIERK